MANGTDYVKLVTHARTALNEGKNITASLREYLNVPANTPEIIEIAYDLQAGSYIENVRNDMGGYSRYCDELAFVLRDACSRIHNIRTVLDIGTGEMTIFSGVASRVFSANEELFACDISLSRLLKGREFINSSLKSNTIQPIFADFFELPFSDKSIDVVMSTHALEPNGGDECRALIEIFRVARKLVVLFEPSYENNSPEGRARMDSLGYVKSLRGAIEGAGGSLIDSMQIINNDFLRSPLNPTWAYVCKPGVALELAAKLKVI